MAGRYIEFALQDFITRCHEACPPDAPETAICCGSICGTGIYVSSFIKTISYEETRDTPSVFTGSQVCPSGLSLDIRGVASGVDGGEDDGDGNGGGNGGAEALAAGHIPDSAIHEASVNIVIENTEIPVRITLGASKEPTPTAIILLDDGVQEIVVSAGETVTLPPVSMMSGVLRSSTIEERVTVTLTNGAETHVVPVRFFHGGARFDISDRLTSCGGEPLGNDETAVVIHRELTIGPVQAAIDGHQMKVKAIDVIDLKTHQAVPGNKVEEYVEIIRPLSPVTGNNGRFTVKLRFRKPVSLALRFTDETLHARPTFDSPVVSGGLEAVIKRIPAGSPICTHPPLTPEAKPKATVVLDGSGSIDGYGRGLFYTWTVESLSTETPQRLQPLFDDLQDQSRVFIALEPGRYRATLEVTAVLRVLPGPPSHETSIEFTVDGPPELTIESPAPDQVFCAPSTEDEQAPNVVLQARAVDEDGTNPSDPVPEIRWEISELRGGGAPPIHGFGPRLVVRLPPSSWSAKAIATDSCNHETTRSVNFRVDARPDVTLAPPSTCASPGDRLEFTGTVFDPEDGPIPTDRWMWFLDDEATPVFTGGPGFTLDLAATPLPTGLHTLTLRARDGPPCQQEGHATVSFEIRPLQVGASPTAIVAGGIDAPPHVSSIVLSGCPGVEAIVSLGGGEGAAAGSTDGRARLIVNTPNGDRTLFPGDTLTVQFGDSGVASARLVSANLVGVATVRLTSTGSAPLAAEADVLFVAPSSTLAVRAESCTARTIPIAVELTLIHQGTGVDGHTVELEVHSITDACGRIVPVGSHRNFVILGPETSTTGGGQAFLTASALREGTFTFRVRDRTAFGDTASSVRYGPSSAVTVKEPDVVQIWQGNQRLGADTLLVLSSCDNENNTATLTAVGVNHSDGCPQLDSVLGPIEVEWIAKGPPGDPVISLSSGGMTATIRALREGVGGTIQARGVNCFGAEFQAAVPVKVTGPAEILDLSMKKSVKPGQKFHATVVARPAGGVLKVTARPSGLLDVSFGEITGSPELHHQRLELKALAPGRVELVVAYVPPDGPECEAVRTDVVSIEGTGRLVLVDILRVLNNGRTFSVFDSDTDPVVFRHDGTVLARYVPGDLVATTCTTDQAVVYEFRNPGGDEVEVVFTAAEGVLGDIFPVEGPPAALAVRRFTPAALDRIQAAVTAQGEIRRRASGPRFKITLPLVGQASQAGTTVIQIAQAIPVGSPSPEPTGKQEVIPPRIVAIGDSAPAGMQHGTLLHSLQVKGFVPLLVQRIEKGLQLRQGAESPKLTPYPLPLISDDGLPLPQFDLRETPPGTPVGPGQRKGERLGRSGFFKVPVQAWNLAVPEFKLRDVLQTTMVTNLPIGRPLANEILMGPLFDEFVEEQGFAFNPLLAQAPQVVQAVRIKPTLLLIWAGTNDSILPLFQPRAVQEQMTPVQDFRRDLRTLLDRVRKPPARDVLIATLPDLTEGPMLRLLGKPLAVFPGSQAEKTGFGFTFREDRLSAGQQALIFGLKVRLGRSSDPLDSIVRDLVLPRGIVRERPAEGDPVPTGRNAPAGSSVPFASLTSSRSQQGVAEALDRSDGLLAMAFDAGSTDLSGKSYFTDDEILTPEEGRLVSGRIAQFNEVIRREAGTTPDVVVVPVDAEFGRFQDFERALGDRSPTERTLFSLDALHPNSAGHGRILGEYIEVLNQRLRERPFGGLERGFQIPDGP